MSVVVAVRVRPFNARERRLNSRLCVRMEGNATTLIDEKGEERTFAFDHSFWSHDGYGADASGRLTPDNSAYVGQDEVYASVGRQILENALAGYHCCLFAYGQTGAGKSYSMVGFGANKGIVPMVCEGIFAAAAARPNVRFEVNLSMFEVYNERVQDLLVPIAARPPGGLRVRVSPALGAYVEGLSRHAMDSFEAIEARLAEGNRNRTIAATQMNATSSRAHTIFAIEVRQRESIDGKTVERLSVINLVDLAGSEKLGKSGAAGDRLREGCSINKSLLVLGQVIAMLADREIGKQKKSVIPYRDSVLTQILRNALGGNSKTLMICAISPAAENFAESLSTLRYADQAKRVQCNAVVNEAENDKNIRELRGENEELRRIIAQLRLGSVAALPAHIADELERGDARGDARGTAERVRELEALAEGRKRMLEEMDRSFEARLREERERCREPPREDYTVPHLTNLNEDELLSGKIYHNISLVGELLIGRREAVPPPQIVLQSAGVQPRHARIERRGDDFYLSPCCPAAADYLFLNGDRVPAAVQLQNLDRLAFGVGPLFLFRNPQSPTPPRGLAADELDWERCRNELAAKQRSLARADGAELAAAERRCEELVARHEEEKAALQEEHQRKLEEIVQQMSVLPFERDEMTRSEIRSFEGFRDEFDRSFAVKFEFEKAKREEIANEFARTFQAKDAKRTEQKITKIFPNIVETNLIAAELRRAIRFSAHVSYLYFDVENLQRYERQKKYRIKVRVDNDELGYSYFWDLRKFTSRYFMIRELAEQFAESGVLPVREPEFDPFWDPPEYQKVGEGFLKLMSLAYLTDNPSELALVGDGGRSGTLAVDLVPTNAAGQRLEPDDEVFDEFVDNPNDVLGRDVHFQLQIGRARLPVGLSREPYVQYTLRVSNERGELVDSVFNTPPRAGNSLEIDFGYSRAFCYRRIDEETLKYILKMNVCFELFALPNLAKTAEKCEIETKNSIFDYTKTENSKNKILDFEKKSEKSEGKKNVCKAF